jgi:uncharacterized DUF497 family protein
MLIFDAHGFDWDAANRLKCQKHGLSVEDVEAVFGDEFHVTPDTAHSRAETRFIAVGRGDGVRPIFVAFTLRRREGKAMIRPISARYMHRKEIARYEKESAASEDR